jgi:hypothetical protein
MNWLKASTRLAIIRGGRTVLPGASRPKFQTSF